VETASNLYIADSPSRHNQAGRAMTDERRWSSPQAGTWIWDLGLRCGSEMLQFSKEGCVFPGVGVLDDNLLSKLGRVKRAVEAA
jgi:hypothetical protein